MPRLVLLLTTLIWGATFPATKAALDQIPPLSFLCLRFLLGTVLIVIWFAAVNRRLVREKPVVAASAVATLFLFFGYVLQTVGLRYTSASNSAFLTVLYVIFVPLFLRRFGGRVLLAATVAVAGLWLLVKPSADVNVGDLLTIGCAAAFAGHIICLERFTRLFDAPSLLAWQMIAVTALFVPIAWWEHASPGAFAPTTVLLIGLGVTGVLATGAFAVQMWVQQLVPAQQVALIFASEPVYAAWLSWYFLGETLDLQGWIGSALILLAVLTGAFASQSPPAAPLVADSGSERTV
ncbi:DMT family transporter [Candidatus Nitrospira inopinata]|jgi:drug/metabolite transporter (DMT)-like permease|uniref:Putative Transporter, eamA family n=1 Tax=Candidatus Nitrospira inopinata TaxID=1715989 RepID=A0A0S4KZM1_9BACT|nr:DMT family transporter [Candidatus Nitrospira inopinata]CUQ67186.1 putative Transporter, eamA family [Candidatus Nitrospira inopinata]